MYGFTCVCAYGCMGVMGVWVYGCMGLWVYVYVGACAWVYTHTKDVHHFERVRFEAWRLARAVVAVDLGQV